MIIDFHQRISQILLENKAMNYEWLFLEIDLCAAVLGVHVVLTTDSNEYIEQNAQQFKHL